MSKIYLPINYVNNCNVFYDNYIRSYTNNSRTEWVDIYYKDDYAEKVGYSQYSQNVVCDNLNTYTTDIMYRYDITNILICFLILSLFLVYLPFKMFGRLFGRWLKW